MKTLIVCVLAALTTVSAMAANGRPGHHPDPSNLHVRIMFPTQRPVMWTTFPYLRVGGVVGPEALLGKVTYSTSAGESGDCSVTNIPCPTNAVHCHPKTHFHTPQLALEPGSNLVTIVAVPNDDQLDPVSDSLLVYYRAVTNHRPRIISRPRRWWGTNDTYHYTLRAADIDGDPLRLRLDTRGPVLATATELTNGIWHISAALTSTVTPRRVAFRAIVSDGTTRPAVQRWSVWCRKPWRAIRRRQRQRRRKHRAEL